MENEEDVDKLVGENYRTTMPTSIRVTTKCKWLWDALCIEMGLTRTGVIETAIRHLAKEEGVYRQGEKPGD